MPGDKVTDRPQRPGQSRVRTWKKVVFALVVTGCFFLALELVLALAGITPLIKQQDPFSGFTGAMPLFVEDSREPARRTTATNKLAYFNSQSFSETKAAGTRRVFCLGGSTTYGRPYNDTTSFAGWLRELLPLADPAHRWEVINAGGISYASYRVAAVTEQLLEMDPDLLIIYTGHNEFLEDVTFPNWKDRSRLLEQATLLAAHSRLFTLLSQRLQPLAETNRQQPRLPGEVDEILNHTVGPSSYKRDDRHRDQVLSFFEFNLRRIVQLAHRRRVPVLLVTPASNLRDFSPFKSQHRDGLNEQDQQHWQKLVDQASRLAIQRQWEQAAGLLEEAVALDDRHAETHFQLATALLACGQHARALVHFHRARDEDVCPLRALTPLAMTVRKVAGDASVPLVDFEELLSGQCQDQNGHSIVGADYFLDHLHPTIEGHRLLAEAIIKQLETDRWWNPGQQWNQQARQQVSRRILDSIDQADHARARRNLAKVLNWSGKHMEAGVLSVSVLEQLPDDPEALSIAAAYMRQLGRIETAIDYLSRRKGVTPDDVDTLRRLSSLLVEAGQLEEALSCQQQVTRLQPDDAQAFHHLGMVLAELKRFDEATVHYRKAIELDKSDANIHYHLGIALAEKLDLEGSRDAFQQALRLSPRDRDASFNLAVIHGQLGQRLEAVDPDAARRHYRSALELEPGMTDIQDRLQGLGESP